jgi:predicted nucleic-acid-binding protein
MTAVDTNVLVRLLTADEPRQTKATRKLLVNEQIWIAKTVLLETAWVLAKIYKFDETAIREALTKLLGFENVAVEDATSVQAAFALADQGIDFADAMHLSSTPSGAVFASFDRAFVRRATRAGVSGVSEI